MHGLDGILLISLVTIALLQDLYKQHACMELRDGYIASYSYIAIYIYIYKIYN